MNTRFFLFPNLTVNNMHIAQSYQMSSQWELYVQVINVSVDYTKAPVQHFAMKSARNPISLL